MAVFSRFWADAFVDMSGTPPIRFAVVGLICVPVYLLLGFLMAATVHTGPHDWFMLPGITIEHYYGHGLSGRTCFCRPWQYAT